MAMTRPKSSQVEHRGDTVQKVIDDITQEDGVLNVDPSWADVPKLKGANANNQAQALANRTEFLKGLTQANSYGDNVRFIQEKIAEELRSAADWTGIFNDGSASSSSGLNRFIRDACLNGGRYIIPPGEYKMDAGVSATVGKSVEFLVDPGARFVANPGFPAQKMFLFTSDGRELTFKWHGGSFDNQNQPNSLAGQANDIFYVALANASVDVVLDKTYSGEDWTTAGGDSHLFIAGCRSGSAVINDCQGAVDAGVYVSANQDATFGTDLFVDGSFKKCNVAAIAKRNFKRISLNGRVSDCANGIAFGGAETSTNESENGQVFQLNVMAQRTTMAANLQVAVSGIVNVVSKDMGCTISGTPVAASALALSGSSQVMGNVVADGVNPDVEKNNNFNAVTCSQRFLNDVIYQSKNNSINITARGIGRVVREVDASDSNNFFGIYSDSVEPLIAGTSSTFSFVENETGYFKQRATVVEFASTTGRIARFTSSTNKTNALDLLVQAGDENGEVLLAVTGRSNEGWLSLAGRGGGGIKMNPGQIKNFTDDVAAADGGVPVAGLYRTGSTLKIRMS